MYILSVDTTAKTASVCVARDDEKTGILPVAEFTLNNTVTHSESLLPMIDSVLKMSRLELDDIDVFAITAGPGSFTGVRIGVSAIKGLAFSLKDKKPVPCIPVSTLRCLAENISGYPDSTILCPLMDARREQFYNALFEVRDGKVIRLCEDRTVTASELSAELSEKYGGKAVLCGDGAMLYYSLLEKYPCNCVELCSTKDLYQRAFSVAVVSLEVVKSQGFDVNEFTGDKLAPVYLRLSQAERERNERLGISDKN